MSVTSANIRQTAAVSACPWLRLSDAAKIAWAQRLIVIVLLLFWEIWARLGGNTDLIAPPTAIVRALFANVLSDPDIRTAIALTLFEEVVDIAGDLASGARPYADLQPV